MKLHDYILWTDRTAKYPDHPEFRQARGLEQDVIAPSLYASMGFQSEVGEVLGKLKKIIRDDTAKPVFCPEKAFNDEEVYEVNLDKHADAILDELGDVAWYVARLMLEVHRRADTKVSLDGFYASAFEMADGPQNSFELLQRVSSEDMRQFSQRMSMIANPSMIGANRREWRGLFAHFWPVLVHFAKVFSGRPVTLAQLLQRNVDKLESRLVRNVIGGSGDTR